MTGLVKLVGSYPQLSVVVNFNDGAADGTPRKGSLPTQCMHLTPYVSPIYLPGTPRKGSQPDASLFSRIITTWVRGPKERVWAQLLRPSTEALRHASYVWIFDPSLAVHPVHNPLAQMVETLRATDASIVYAMVRRACIPLPMYLPCISQLTDASIVYAMVRSHAEAHNYTQPAQRFHTPPTPIHRYGLTPRRTTTLSPPRRTAQRSRRL